MAVVTRADLLMKNLDLIEKTLTVATFNNDGIQGLWSVTDDAVYLSEAKYSEFFRARAATKSRKQTATVTYKIMNYDFLGPEEFHNDRELDPTY